MLTFIERTEQILLNSSQRVQNINHNLFSAFRSQTSNSTFNREKNDSLFFEPESYFDTSVNLSCQLGKHFTGKYLHSETQISP